MTRQKHRPPLFLIFLAVMAVIGLIGGALLIYGSLNHTPLPRLPWHSIARWAVHG